MNHHVATAWPPKWLIHGYSCQNLNLIHYLTSLFSWKKSKISRKHDYKMTWLKDCVYEIATLSEKGKD